VLLSGLAVSLMLFGVTWMLVRSRVQVERTSKEGAVSEGAIFFFTLKR
jgi:hypothetical protein